MKVLLVSQCFWPETFRINETAQALRSAGCEVTVLTGQPNYPDGKIFPGYRAWNAGCEVYEHCPVYRVPVFPRGRGGALRLVLNYLSFVVSATAVAPWLLRRQRVDVVLVYATSPILQCIPAVWLAWLKGAPLVSWVQDLWPESLSATGFVHNPRALAAVASVVRWIYRRNDLLLVQSPAFLASVRRMAGATPVAYHPNPGELAFSAAAGRVTAEVTEVAAKSGPALTLPPGFNVVFAGNLGTVQALDTLLAAAVLLRDTPDIRFVLVGSGSRSGWVQQEATRLGLTNVQLAGRFATQDMPAIMAQASALLVSLVRDPVMAQTVPNKLQSYLAAARPVIASLDGEGARVVMQAEAGLTCAAQDAPALADAVRALYALTPAARLEMGQRGRRYYDENFEPLMLAKKLAAQLQTLVQASVQERNPIP